MKQADTLQEISTVCTTPIELIQSEEFGRGIQIVADQVRGFDSETIQEIFKTLGEGKTSLSEEDKETLSQFLQNKQVQKKGQALLSKLKSVSININTKNIEEHDNFNTFLKELFSDNGYAKVQNCIGEVADMTHLTLNTYEGFTKKTLTLKNGETKEVYMEDTTLKVDSSEWEKTKIDGHKVKINSEGDIIEYLNGKEQGEQLFTWEAAMREAEKLGKRLPTQEELLSPEYKESIVNTTKVFPGYRCRNGSDIGYRRDYACFWSSRTDKDNAYYLYLLKGDSEASDHWLCETNSLSVRCLKD